MSGRQNVGKENTSVSSLLRRVRMFLHDSKVTPDELLSLSLRIKSGHSPDYEKEAAIFAVLYFLENLSKCRSAALHLLQLGRPTRVLDIGSGSGASVCGLVLGLEHFCPSGLNVEFTCVERSPSQERLFRSISLPWLREKGINVSFKKCDALAFLRNCRESFDFVILSFVLIEMTQAERAEVMTLIKNAAQFHDYLIIDKAPEGGSYAFYSNGSIIRLQHPAPPFKEPSIPSVLRDYFVAWESHDRRLLRKLFHNQATYRIDPNRTLRGFGEIEQYWIQNAKEQKGVKWRVLNFITFNNFIIAEWECAFQRNGIPYGLYGFLKIENVDGRIVHFDEAYHRVN